MGSCCDLWWLGVLLEILSTMSGTVGKQVIRLSETVKKTAPLRSKPLFAAGLVINTLCGPIIDMAAYSFAAQSLIAPFGGLDVVWNAALAPYILQEKLTRQRVVGCALICLGTVMAGAFGSHTDKEYSIDVLEDLLVNFRVLAYFIVFFAWYLLNVMWLMRRPKGDPIRGVSLGATAGTITGNMFCVKAAVEIIQATVHDGQSEAWLHWLPYALLFGAIFFAVTNVFYMTRGLQEFEALFMVTVYEGSMIMSNCISGAVVLLDLKELEYWRVALYWLGVLVVGGGMLVVFGNEVKNKSSLASGTASLLDGSGKASFCPKNESSLASGKASLPDDELKAVLARASPASHDGTRRSLFARADVDVSCMPMSTDEIPSLPPRSVSEPSLETPKCVAPDAPGRSVSEPALDTPSSSWADYSAEDLAAFCAPATDAEPTTDGLNLLVKSCPTVPPQLRRYEV